MSYIGNPIVSTDFPVDTFSGNGSTTAFTLTQAPASVNAIIVAVSGVLQEPSTYTISGTTLTFTAAPPSGTSNISVRHLGVAGIPNTPASGSVQYSSLNSSLQGTLVGRNRIINGAMVIDQRNAGAAVTANDAYPVDRMRVQMSTDGAYSAQQDSSAPAGFNKSVKITTTTADSSLGSTQYLMFQQRIEGTNTADLDFGKSTAKTITLSFWIRSSLTGTFGGALGNSSFNRSYPFTYTISAANTWEYKTVTVVGDTTGTWVSDSSDYGIVVRFGLGVGSTYSGTAGSWQASGLMSATGAVSVIGTLNATWYITGVQLEVGSTATSFDYLDYGRVLQQCQRYYQKTYDVGTVPGTTYNFEYNPPATAVGTGNFGTPCCRPFIVSMRASPTITTYDGAGNSGRISAWGVGNNQTYSSLTVSQNQLLSFDFGYNSVAGRHYTFSYVASAEL